VRKKHLRPRLQIYNPGRLPALHPHSRQTLLLTPPSWPRSQEQCAISSFQHLPVCDQPMLAVMRAVVAVTVFVPLTIGGRLAGVWSGSGSGALGLNLNRTSGFGSGRLVNLDLDLGSGLVQVRTMFEYQKNIKIFILYTLHSTVSIQTRSTYFGTVFNSC
jgi:hypothetical protein